MKCSIDGSALIVASLTLLGSVGCGKSASEKAISPTAGQTAAVIEEVVKTKSPSAEPPVFEVGAEELLSARLPESDVANGWIRLFDGHTLFGWEIAGKANWRVEDESIVVDQGEAGLLCTSMPWQNYELTLEFKADEATNSGVFLRTPLEPLDPAVDCYEVNIAPADNPFPTGGIVKRLKAKDWDQKPEQWHTMRLVLDGSDLTVALDGEEVCAYSDPEILDAGRIGLQHNSGKIAFRNIRLRPLGMRSLLDAELSLWKKYPEMPGEFTTTEEGWLHVQGGRTQLESKQTFDNFVLLAEYKLPEEAMNSGIFFRCIPGDEMMGYECQLSNEIKNANPLAPADCGTGGIFRRQDARIVAGESGQWATVLLASYGPKIAAWVNGIQVSDWYDDRKSDENPRKGSRLEAGTLMIQGHDPGTDALFKQIKVVVSAPTAGEAATPGETDASSVSETSDSLTADSETAKAGQ